MHPKCTTYTAEMCEQQSMFLGILQVHRSVSQTERTYCLMDLNFPQNNTSSDNSVIQDVLLCILVFQKGPRATKDYILDDLKC